MATIKTTIELNDKMSSKMNKINNALGQATQNAEKFNDSIHKAESQGTGYEKVAKAVQKTGKEAQKGSGDFDDLGRKATNSAHNAENAWSRVGNKVSSTAIAIKTAIANMALNAIVDGAKNLMSMSDTITSTTARLDNMNKAFEKAGRGTLSLEGTTQAIYEAAQRARGSYADMADAVAKFGNNAGRAFNSTEELIQFSENIQKAFAVGGTGAQESAGAMLQLTQAMAAGVLRGEELNSVLEGAPQIARAIESYMGIAEGSIKNVASQGLVTADIVKNAVLQMGSSLTEQLDNIPLTFQQSMQRASNTMMMTLQPVLSEVAQLLGGQDFNNMLTEATSALQTLMPVMSRMISYVSQIFSLISPIVNQLSGTLAKVMTALQPVFDSVMDIINVLAEQLNPIITALEEAFISLTPTLTIIFDMISSIVEAVAPLLTTLVEIGGLLVEIIAPILESIALRFQSILDLVLPLVEPINHIVQAIGELLAALQPVLSTFMQLSNVALPLFKALKPAIDLVCVALDIIAAVIMTITGNTEAMGEAWTRVWEGMKSFAIGCINAIIDAINFLFGWCGVAIPKIGEAAGAKANDMLNKGGGGRSFGAKQGPAPLVAAPFSGGATMNTNKADSMAQSLSDIASSTGSLASMASGGDGGSRGGGGGSSSGLKTHGEVNIAEEDIQLLKDVAQVEWVNKYTTMQPNLNVTFGDVHKTADVDEVLNTMETMLTQAYASSLSI